MTAPLPSVEEKDQLSNDQVAAVCARLKKYVVGMAAKASLDPADAQCEMWLIVKENG